MVELGDLDQLESLLRGVTVADGAGRGRHRAGPRPARRRRDALAATARRADPPAHRGRAHRADRVGAAADAAGDPPDRFERPRRAVLPAHQGPDRSAPDRAHGLRPRAHARHQAATSTAIRSGSTCSARSATPSSAAPATSSDRATGTPVGLVPDDFEIERTEHLTRSSTVLMLDLSMSMPMEGRFVPAKKVAMALHSLIASQFPRDYLGVVVFSETARVIRAERDPGGELGLRVRHEHAPRADAGPPAARPSARNEADHHGHRRRTDGARHSPTARCSSTTRRCARRSRRRCARCVRCTNAGIRINTFMLGATQSLKAFVERISRDQPRPGVLHHAREPR